MLHETIQQRDELDFYFFVASSFLKSKSNQLDRDTGLLCFLFIESERSSGGAPQGLRGSLPLRLEQHSSSKLLPRFPVGERDENIS